MPQQRNPQVSHTYIHTYYHSCLCLQRWGGIFSHIIVLQSRARISPLPLISLRHISINELVYPPPLSLSIFFSLSFSLYPHPPFISLLVYASNLTDRDRPLLLGGNRRDRRWGQGHKEMITRLIGPMSRQMRSEIQTRSLVDKTSDLDRMMEKGVYIL